MQVNNNGKVLRSKGELHSIRIFALLYQRKKLDSSVTIVVCFITNELEQEVPCPHESTQANC